MCIRDRKGAEASLEHVSFQVWPGETIGVIGGTGSGKSTLVNLIPRFYDVTGGRITLDGVDIRDLSQHKLRELLGFVPQKGMLLSLIHILRIPGPDQGLAG